MTKRTIDIEIPVLVGSDGRWAAWGSHEDEVPRWDELEEMLAEYDADTETFSLPAGMKRFIARISVTVPEEAETVEGTVEEAE